MNAFVTRCAAVSSVLIALVLGGCFSAQEFDYNGAKLDTLNAISLDSRRPYPLAQDVNRLGPTREVVVDGEEIYIGASEDGSTIQFRIKFYAFGEKSTRIKQSTERSTKVLAAIIKDLQESGFLVSKRIAIIDSANVIGYKIGGPPRVIGFYLFSEPGAYEALLPVIEEKAAAAAKAAVATAETSEPAPVAETHSEHMTEE